MSAVHGDQLTHDAQSQTGPAGFPAAGLVHPVEPFKDMILILLGYAHSVVPDPPDQILYNLMDNAIKYTPDGGKIRVTLEAADQELIWRVKDNGVGIPEETQSHIFERFYRVDKARSRETGGTGLGLSIVRQLATLQGGTVSVNSSPGQGSEFTVVFPREGEDE